LESFAGHSDSNPNICPQYLSGYFDTTSGQKRDAASYARIAASIGTPAESILFLSDRIEGQG
jgi:methionine salvage enolase-phosphatase E1